MTRQELRDLVWSRWGTRLEHATLAQLRDALPELQALASPPPADGVFIAEGVPGDYEAAMREFFGHVLAADDDAAFVQTWLVALELWLAIMAEEEGR